MIWICGGKIRGGFPLPSTPQTTNPQPQIQSTEPHATKPAARMASAGKFSTKSTLEAPSPPSLPRQGYVHVATCRLILLRQNLEPCCKKPKKYITGAWSPGTPVLPVRLATNGLHVGQIWSNIGLERGGSSHHTHT